MIENQIEHLSSALIRSAYQITLKDAEMDQALSLLERAALVLRVETSSGAGRLLEKEIAVFAAKMKGRK